MKIEKIVAQLTEKDFTILCDTFRQTKADKYLTLLEFYREEKKSEKEILTELNIKTAAFYTLKSRLSDKIQEHLYKSTIDTRVELLQNVANIERLLYQVPKDTAIGMLEKLEVELLKNDMPNELITVYKALKKLHVYSQKYYDYQQLYNKNVAFNLAQDKAEEVLSVFCRTLCEYYVSHNSNLQDILVLYKKEMNTICRLHQSKRLTVYKNILTIHFALFCPVESELVNDATTEELLKETYAILESNTDDSSYKHLINVLHFLSFEYYHQLKLNKNALTYYEKIADGNHSILLYNHTAHTMRFLISKLEWHQSNNKTAELNLNEDFIYVPETSNMPERILYKHYLAAVNFFNGKTNEAAQCLNSLLNEVSFKDLLHGEIETKLFLTLLLLLSDKYDQAEIIFRSVSRKIQDEDNEIKHHSAILYVKMLKIVFAGKATNKLEKLKEVYQLFAATNLGPNKILSYIKLDDKHLLTLSKV